MRVHRPTHGRLRRPRRVHLPDIHRRDGMFERGVRYRSGERSIEVLLPDPVAGSRWRLARANQRSQGGRAAVSSLRRTAANHVRGCPLSWYRMLPSTPTSLKLARRVWRLSWVPDLSCGDAARRLQVIESAWLVFAASPPRRRESTHQSSTLIASHRSLQRGGRAGCHNGGRAARPPLWCSCGTVVLPGRHGKL